MTNKLVNSSKISADINFYLITCSFIQCFNHCNRYQMDHKSYVIKRGRLVETYIL